MWANCFSITMVMRFLQKYVRYSVHNKNLHSKMDPLPNAPTSASVATTDPITDPTASFGCAWNVYDGWPKDGVLSFTSLIVTCRAEVAVSSPSETLTLHVTCDDVPVTSRS